MKVQILEAAQGDLTDGYHFKDSRPVGMLKKLVLVFSSESRRGRNRDTL